MAKKQARARRRRVLDLPDLAPQWRLAFLVVGWLLVLLGVVGLFLPILQGFLFLAFGAATLSLVSEHILRGLRWLMGPCPRAWRATLRMRRRLLKWMLRRLDSGDSEDA